MRSSRFHFYLTLCATLSTAFLFCSIQLSKIRTGSCFTFARKNATSFAFRYLQNGAVWILFLNFVPCGRNLFPILIQWSQHLTCLKPIAKFIQWSDALQLWLCSEYTVSQYPSTTWTSLLLVNRQVWDFWSCLWTFIISIKLLNRRGWPWQSSKCCPQLATVICATVVQRGRVVGECSWVT